MIRSTMSFTTEPEGRAPMGGNSGAAHRCFAREKPNPTDTDINHAMAGNICHCGTHQRIRRAIHLAAQWKSQGGAK